MFILYNYMACTWPHVFHHMGVRCDVHACHTLIYSSDGMHTLVELLPWPGLEGVNT